MNEFLHTVQLILVLALVFGVFTLVVYGYKKYLEPVLLAKATSELEQKLQRVNAVNNAQIAEIKRSAQTVLTQIANITTAVDALDMDKVLVGDLTIMAENLKELARGLDAASKRLGSKVPSPVASIFNSSDPRKMANSQANRAGYYGNDATTAFWNAVTAKYPGKYKDMSVFLALPKEDQDVVVNSVKKHNLPVNN